MSKKQKGENWYYMGVIDPDYPEDKLSQDIAKTINKYREFEPVFVLYTGGTVGMVRENPMDPKSPIKTKSLEYVLPHLKRIEEIKNDIHFWELAPPLDSSNIGAKEWIEIARIIQKVYSYYQGFVILHGTDTMAYTASALSFILTNLSKPVILTGAEKPISEPVSDAEPNIVSAIQIASYKSGEGRCQANKINKIIKYYELKCPIFCLNRLEMFNIHHFRYRNCIRTVFFIFMIQGFHHKQPVDISLHNKLTFGV